MSMSEKSAERGEEMIYASSKVKQEKYVKKFITDFIIFSFLSLAYSLFISWSDSQCEITGLTMH